MITKERKEMKKMKRVNKASMRRALSGSLKKIYSCKPNTEIKEFNLHLGKRILESKQVKFR